MPCAALYRIYGTLYELLRGGAIGRIESLDAVENVAYWHYAHSYVRGNWRRAEESSPMILAKSCHDMDIIRWLMGVPCESVSSYGSLAAGSARKTRRMAVQTAVFPAAPVRKDAPTTRKKILHFQ